MTITAKYTPHPATVLPELAAGFTIPDNGRDPLFMAVSDMDPAVDNKGAKNPAMERISEETVEIEVVSWPNLVSLTAKA